MTSDRVENIHNASSHPVIPQFGNKLRDKRQSGSLKKSKSGLFQQEANNINILVFNPGSSSVKYRLIKMPEEKDLIVGEAERVGIKTQGESFISHTVCGEKKTINAYMPDHASAFGEIMKAIDANSAEDKNITVDAFAHRYVHPGKLYDCTVKVGKQELKNLKCTFDLAPLHNPVSHSFMEICEKYPGEISQYAVFDTAFHGNMPPENYTYAIPEKLAEKYGIRRVGFHGISHEFVTAEACKFLKREYGIQKIISCHLGTGGASIAAVKDGKSISNTMGFTPLEGLVMNTRSGDVDISALLHVMNAGDYSIKQTDEALNKKSGVLGAYGLSSDLRDVIKKLESDETAAPVLRLFIKRIKKYLGYYSLLLKKPDVLIFTDSLGVMAPLVREKACEGLECFGISLDRKKNDNYKTGIADISGKSSECKILVVPTNEEIMIAREAYGAHN